MKLISFFLMALCTTAHAAYTVKDGKLVNKETMATQSVQEHYSAALDAHEKKEWPQLLQQAKIVLKNFPGTPFAEEALFYMGIANFHTEALEKANNNLSAYLKLAGTPKHFEEAIECKYSIAEQFQEGSKRHIFGLSFMPKWVPAYEDALAIYEEVVSALPHHELAAKALFGKATLLFQTKEYKSSIEAFQTVIRRFPKHKLAPESYVSIGEVYLSQCQDEYTDPDLLDLATINLRKFRLDFPSDERLRIAETMLLEMQEVYATSLYETGKYFEKVKKTSAAKIYYNKIVATYPETQIAEHCRKKIDEFNQREAIK